MGNVSMRGPALYLVIVLVVVAACARSVAANEDQRIAGQELAASQPAQAYPDFGMAIAAGKDERIARQELAASQPAQAYPDFGIAIAAGKDERIARQELAIPLTLPSTGSISASPTEN